MRGSSAWMFDSHFPGSAAADIQALNLALLRLQVTAFYIPIRRLLKGHHE